jgi:serine/threonine protein kinase
MKLSLDEFWTLAGQSRVIDPGDVKELKQQFAESCRANRRSSSRAAAEWLVQQRRLTAYQAKILLKGMPGPFQFDRYRILQPRLVAAANARRFEGLHQPTNHRVLLHFWPGRNDETWRVASGQVAAAARIRHPNLDRIYGAVAGPDYQLAASEWPEGTPLHDILRQRKRLPVDQACGLTWQLATGLAHLHALGLVHGHIRPAEAVVQTGGHVKLLRQPFWTPAPLVLSRYQSPNGCSAANYLAPEFLRPGTTPDALTDIYALGCVFYEIVAGRPPFAGETVETVMAQHATQRIRPLEDFAEVPAGLTELASYMMAKRRALRHSDLTAVADKLNAFVPPEMRQSAPRVRATEAYFLAELEPVGARPLVLPELSTDIRPITAVLTRPIRPGGQRKASRLGWLTLLVTLLSVLTVSGILLIYRPWLAGDDVPHPATQHPRQETDVATGPQPPDDVELSLPMSTSPNAGTVATKLIDDDGETLWASPTSGQPIQLKYTPSGAQMFVHLRPAAILASAEGPATLQALGPGLNELRQDFFHQTQLDLSQIDRLLLALTPQDVGSPLIMSVAELSETNRRAVRERTTSRAAKVEGELARIGDFDVFFPAADPHVVVWGNLGQLEEISAAGVPPPLRRQMEMLRSVADADRHLTILVAPNFLAADGQCLLTGTWEALRQPILKLLGDGILAASFSVHLDAGAYFELRWVVASDHNPLEEVANRLGQLQELPAQVSAFLGGMPIDPYWQPLAMRIPLMVEFVGKQLRAGAEGEMAVLNAVLPPGAAHNLTLACELALASSGPATSTYGPPTQAPVATSIDRLLQWKTTLVVQQQSFDVIVQEFADAIRKETGNEGLSIQIMGADLQPEGITRNQEIRNLNLRNLPVRQVLTQLVMRANPSPVIDARQAEQKLVWLIAPDEPMRIVITTRAAARQKQLALPREFVAELAP